ncbi:stellacyanin-like [Rosa rugosa]|uniref:stellacyanin-like n=1 Tax=Rosa rugosa TaxID=74645 RepID=UPI002B4054CC|nr:stellacyanin-like [Rosa rugosa]
MVSSQLGLIGCSLLVVALALLKGATAESYTVGEDLGWNIPPAGSVAYSTWAASKRFQLGDVVVFKWTGPHTVAEVTQADFSSCTKSNPIALYDSSPARITLSSLNGTRYFICTEDNHCSVLGQKVAITIGGTGQYAPGDDNSDDDDDWWRWNSASSLTIGTALSAVISTAVIFFLNYI